MALIQGGLVQGATEEERETALGSLWALTNFGGEKENAFVLELMRTTEDESVRKIAIRVGIGICMMPENWEKWVREAATNPKCGDKTRFNDFEEAYWIGMRGDEDTRQRVEDVLSEYAWMAPAGGYGICMPRWLENLKARKGQEGPWEENAGQAWTPGDPPPTH